jgi:hypothetical protein
MSTDVERQVRYDADRGALVMADRERVIGADASNRQVLENYVDLVEECRGRRVGRLAEVRDDDVDALAEALDLDADRLVAEIEAVLALEPAQARTLVDRLRARRLQLAGAVVAAGVVVGGLVVAGAPGDASDAPPPPAAEETTTADGVTLIPPLVIEAPDQPATDEGVVPADATADQEWPEVTTEDGVTLIPPLVIERSEAEAEADAENGS